MGSAASPFIIDDAIIGFAQPLTETLNQLASGLRRACDLVEELGRCEEFYLDLAGGPNGRTAGPVFHDAHLSYKLPRPTVPRRMGSPSSSRIISTVPLSRRQTPSAGSPSLKRTWPSAKCLRVIAILSIGNSLAAPGGGAR